MNINFQVSTPYLIAQIINRIDSSSLNNRDLKEMNDHINDLELPEYLKPKIIEIESTEEFKKLYEENIHYMEKIRNYYEKNKTLVDEYLKRVLKLNLDNIEITAYITHPTTNFGLHIGNNTFIFGHRRGLIEDNYNLINLIHEALHVILPYKKLGYECEIYKSFKGDDWEKYWNNLTSEKKEIFNTNYIQNDIILHSIIELIADDELYTILTDESKYDEKQENLIDFKKRLYSRWFVYLDLNQSEILKRVGPDINMNDFNCERIKNAKDIREFISICIEDLALKNVNVVNKL